jgi:amidase
VLLGKANLSEWANIRSMRAASGWSARGGQTRNPHVLDRSPSGSSSGSAAAVAAGLCTVAVGTETDGSITAPASGCGVVGIKPTVGLASRRGIVPIALSQDTAGPLARTVTDAAILLGALAGEDAADPITATARGRIAADLTKTLDPDGLRGARLGYARNLESRHPATDQLARAAIEEMRRRGATVIEVELPNTRKLDDPEMEVLLFELHAQLDAYLAAAASTATVRSIADVIAFNAKHADRELRFFGQELFERALRKGPLSSPDYVKALADCRRLARAEGIDAVMDAGKLDALVAPTTAPACPIDLVLGDHWVGGATTPAAVAGYPHVTVPMGFVQQLPVGISFFGRAWSEPLLLRLAFAYEQATRHRRAPRFLPALDVGGPT